MLPVEAVTVSVNCGDFLAETAKWNRGQFKKWVVVTTPDDKETREVCRRYALHCLVTEDDKRDGDFSKGRLVERGLQQLSADSWILHLDSDIVLPMNFNAELRRAHLDPECIYGCDRFMVRSHEQWQKVVQSGYMHTSGNMYPHGVNPPHGFDIGCRWADSDGYVPIGFFQLWHRGGGEEEWRGVRTKPYPISHGNACRTDVQHAKQWDRRKRVLIPELFVAHLESEAVPNGKNWNGRKTARFGNGLLTSKPTHYN